jgi:aryl carrier-like protein
VLTGRPTEAEIEATICGTIVELLERSGRSVPAFDGQDDLASTGLTSLDLAALVARLQRRWRIDPFLETTAITEVRTVGDLCRAYRDSLDAG